ncbi:hypothetical protein BDR26DRAFT_1003386, partial [Obelidium mucronatum]
MQVPPPPALTPAEQALLSGSQMQHGSPSENEMEQLLQTLLAPNPNPHPHPHCEPDYGGAFMDMEMEMEMDMKMDGDRGLFALGLDSLNFMPLSPPASVAPLSKPVLPLPLPQPLPLPLPAASAPVAQALASDALARECLVLLNGPAKKKPGRKKKAVDEDARVKQEAGPAKRKAADELLLQLQLPKKQHLALNSQQQQQQQPQQQQQQQLRPLVPLLPLAPAASPANTLSTSANAAQPSISPLPAIDSRRKLSFSSADYLVPTTPSFAPTATSFTPPPLPIPLPPQPNKQQSKAAASTTTPTTATTTTTTTTQQISKHQERMMKNRASADESRRKHKEHVEKLEQMCKDLVAENQLLRSRVLEVETWAASIAAANAVNLNKSASTSPVSVASDSVLLPQDSAASENLFDLFFGGGDFVFGAPAPEALSPPAMKSQKSLTGGAVFMAFLFSFSMLMFPSSIFEKPSPSPSVVPHYLARNSDLVAKSPILGGLSRYMPRVLFDSGSTPNPNAKPALEGIPPLPLLESGYIARDSKGMLVLYTPPIPTPHDIKKDSYPEIGGRTPFLTISAAEGWSRSATSTKAPDTICSFEDILALIANTHIAPTKSAKPAQTATRPILQIPKAKLEALQSLFITSPRSNPTPPAVIPPRVSSNDYLSNNALAKRGPDSLLVVTRQESQPEEDGSAELPSSNDIEEVDTVIPTSPPPIRDDNERASVKRRNLARNNISQNLNKKGPPPPMLKPPLPSNSVGLTAVSTSKNSGTSIDEYCTVKNGPILSIVADLGDELDAAVDGEREGYRLMLDVQVVGA